MATLLNYKDNDTSSTDEEGTIIEISIVIVGIAEIVVLESSTTILSSSVYNGVVNGGWQCA
jgi:hypothetical protein